MSNDALQQSGTILSSIKSWARRFIPAEADTRYVEQPRIPFNLHQGSVQPHELELLRQLVIRSNTFDGPIVEVGILFGLTTSKIALWKDPAKPLFAVDNFGWNPLGLSPEEYFALTSAVLSFLIARGDVAIKSIPKNDFFTSYDGRPPALVFLDAIHTYEETAIDIAWAKGVGARIICGHDYSDEFPGVQQAVNEAGGLQDLCGTVWALRQ